MKLFIKTKSFDRNYLVDTAKYEYKTALDFIFELFSVHHFIDKEAEFYLYELLKASDYSSIEQIPILQLNSILDYFLENRAQYKVNYDEERLSYLLLAAIQSKKIIFTIDHRKIENLKAPIQLKADSTINFFNLGKLDAINFKMI